MPTRPQGLGCLLPTLPPGRPSRHSPSSMHLKCSVEVTCVGCRPLMPSRTARLHPGTGIELSPRPRPLISDARLHPIFIAPTPDAKS